MHATEHLICSVSTCDACLLRAHNSAPLPAGDYWDDEGHDRDSLAAQAHALLDRPGSSTYLCDSACVTTAGGFTVYGAPWTPRFWGAFNLDAGAEGIGARWGAVPPGVDVLMTHGPPLGCRDYVPRVRDHVGCAQLAQHVTQRIRPAVHCFGHIHEGHGMMQHLGVCFVNASIMPWGKLGHTDLNPATVFTLTRLSDGSVAVDFSGGQHHLHTPNEALSGASSSDAAYDPGSASSSPPEDAAGAAWQVMG